MPNFFCSASTAPGLIKELWDFARAAYIDSQLPSLFKERLFVHLSRFCEVRYCVIRHVGFLIGEGKPAGDPKVEPQTIEQVITLLQRSLPDANVLAGVFARLESHEQPRDIPAPETQAEYDLFDALTVIFLEPIRWGRAREAVRRSVGDGTFELLMAFLAFVRTAHYWTETHPELAIEPDMVGVLDMHAGLMRLLFDPSDAERVKAGEALRHALTQLETSKDSLRKSEQRIRWLAAIVQSSDDAITSVSLDGIITSWNAGAERLYGYSAEEIIGERITILIPQEHQGDESTVIGSVGHGDHTEHYETVRRRKDGKLLDVSVTISPVRDAEGNIVGASKIARDITERKREMELLRRQADLLDQSHDAILTWKIGGGIDYWNKGAERLYEYTAEEAIGRSCRDLLRTRSSISAQEIETKIAREDSWYGELIHTTRDGRAVVVESRQVRVEYSGQIHTLETNRDISKRKQAEEELRKSEERFRSSIIQSPVPTILYDDLERILAVSRSWLKAAGGISADELRRIEDWNKIAYGERSSEIMELFRREILAAKPEARVDELMIRTRGGAERLWNCVSSCLGSKSDGRHLFISVAQDVTDQRHHEQRIELLMREARHRTNNILGLIQVVARQTAASEPEHFVERFTERVQALAANQDLLVKNRWHGADVEDLVRVQLAPFADLVDSRIVVRGPKTRLNAAAAQAVGLAVHELATNASKYGALSTDNGRVDVDWRSDGRRFAMKWTERGGPPVSPPARRGFGSTVVKTMVQQTVGGEVDLDYPSSGVKWHLNCPAENVRETASLA